MPDTPAAAPAPTTKTGRFAGFVSQTLGTLARSSPWALVTLIALPLVCITIIGAVALGNPAISQAMAERVADSTRESAEATKATNEALRRLDRSVLMLQETLTAQQTRGNRHATALEQLTAELRRLIGQVDKLTQRVARIEQGSLSNGQEERDDGN